MRFRTDTKTKPRHRSMSPAELKDELRKKDDELNTKDCEYTKLHLHFEELGGAYNRLQRAYNDSQADLNAERNARKAERDKAEKKLATVAAERNDAQAGVRRLTADLTALRAEAELQNRNRHRDRDTERMDMRQLRADIPDDYLDRTSSGWNIPPIPVVPLYEAPFATHRPPTTPTDLPGDAPTITLHIDQPAA